MSMTREEAIKWLEETIQDTDTYWESCSEALQKELDEQKEVFLLALTALRPVSREQVERMQGEWIDLRECYNDIPKRQCSHCGKVLIGLETPFCEACGAPMTDEAVDMAMERLEALHENRD